MVDAAGAATKFRPLTATSTGSFPRPRWLADTDRNKMTFRLAGDDLIEATRDATIVVLRDQEEIGLDLLTDGEMPRITNFIYHIAGKWEGVDTQTLGHTTRYRNRPVDRLVPRITGPVKRTVASSVDDLKFAKRHTTKPLKMAVPGPMTVIDSSANQVYKQEDELAMDIAAAINAELLDLQAAGCDVVQIDEPAMTRYHDKVRAYGAAALDRCLEGIHIPTIVHLCYGYPGGVSLQHNYEYVDLLPELMKTRIGGFTVEFGRSSFDPEVLKACGDRIVMFGCVDPGNSPVPTVDAIEKRIAQVLEWLDPKQVWLAPDCGLMTISRQMAHDKLAAMVEAGNRLRAKL